MGDCPKHDHDKKKRYIKIAAIDGGVIAVVVVFFIILWLALRPTKLRFYVQDSTIYQCNQTSPNTLTTVLQISISSTNPNAGSSIAYTSLRVFAAYRSQKITLPTILPRAYLAHGDDCAWSPFLHGVAVPFTPYLTATLDQERSLGCVIFTVQIHGKLSWKSWMWMSGQYDVHVSCPASYVALDGKDENRPGATRHLQQPVECNAID